VWMTEWRALKRSSGLLLSDYEVADRASVSVATVRRWRQTGQGPRFLKIGASIRYRPEDVEVWLNSRPSGGEATSEQ
jgi:predicted DNA-binding transcriptional regulator AlpA